MINSKKEEEILKNTYKKCLTKVKDSEFHKSFAEEKIKHSFQVIGAGNYIMKHEPYFQRQTPEYNHYAKLAYLFHDIGRFREIELLHENSISSCIPTHLDHGELGAEFLSQHKEYNTPFLVIPVRYHNKLTNFYFASDDYKNLGEHQENITQILNLTKDADKIANFYLIANHHSELGDLFCPRKLLQEDTITTPEVLQDFMNEELISHAKIKTISDRLLNLISWIFDLNFRSSFQFCQDTHCFEKILKIFAQINKDDNIQEIVENKVYYYITKKYHELESHL